MICLLENIECLTPFSASNPVLVGPQIEYITVAKGDALTLNCSVLNSGSVTWDKVKDCSLLPPGKW